MANYSEIIGTLNLEDNDDTLQKIRAIYLELNYISPDNAGDDAVWNFNCSERQLAELKTSLSSEESDCLRDDAREIKTLGDNDISSHSQRKRYTYHQALAELDIKPSELDLYLHQIGLDPKRRVSITPQQITQIGQFMTRREYVTETDADSPNYSTLVEEALQDSKKQVREAVLTGILAENEAVVRGIRGMYRQGLMRSLAQPDFLERVRSEAGVFRAKIQSSPIQAIAGDGADSANILDAEVEGGSNSLDSGSEL